MAEGRGRRKPIAKKLRFEVFKRDRFTCTYCGQRPPAVTLELDHIVAVAEGGADTIDNLTTACDHCNRGKGARGLGDTAPAIDELEVMANIQEMLERKQHLREQTASVSAMREAEDEAMAAVEDRWASVFGNVEGVQRASVRQFARRLRLERIFEAIDAADKLREQKPWQGSYDRWRYFCGACWKMVKQDAPAP